MGDNRGKCGADNNYLYMMKAVACILVIFIHCLFPSGLGKDIQAMSRFAVLYFFVVSGRYLLKNIPDGSGALLVRKRMASRIKHVFTVTLLLTLLYNIYSFIIAGTVGFGIRDLCAQKYNFNELKLLLMFNSGKIIYDYTYDIDHLWYLYAVLYVYILVFIFARFAKKWSGGLAFLFTGMLFVAELLQLYYPIRPFDISIRTWYMVRNWLLEGIPFIMGGVWIDSVVSDNRKTKPAELVRRIIDACSSGQGARRNRITLHVLAVTGLAMSIIEYRRFGEMTVYVGSIVTLCAIMLLGEAYGKVGNGTIEADHQSDIGNIDIKKGNQNDIGDSNIETNHQSDIDNSNIETNHQSVIVNRNIGKDQQSDIGDSNIEANNQNSIGNKYMKAYPKRIGNGFINPNYLCHIGKYLSASVYYFHIMIISILSKLLMPLDRFRLYMWMKPLIAAVISVLVAEGIYRMREKMREGRWRRI